MIASRLYFLLIFKLENEKQGKPILSSTLNLHYSSLHTTQTLHFGWLYNPYLNIVDVPVPTWLELTLSIRQNIKIQELTPTSWVFLWPNFDTQRIQIMCLFLLHKPSHGYS